MSTRKRTHRVWEYFDAPTNVKVEGERRYECMIQAVQCATYRRMRYSSLVSEAGGGAQTYFQRPKLFSEASDLPMLAVLTTTVRKFSSEQVEFLQAIFIPWAL